MKTRLSIQGNKFKINDRLVYSEIPGSSPDVRGLLMNARFIQGVFDDKAAPERFARFGRVKWDPERNTDDLTKALPEWYSYGLRAFTVGFQGGLPVFTTENSTIDNNPFSPDGKSIDEAYLDRMECLIRAADEIGMAVIVSLLYQGQSPRMKNGSTIRNAVRTASCWLRDKSFTNTIIEVANEHTIGNFKNRPLISDPESITTLMEIAKDSSGGMPIGCSAGGRQIVREVAEASDVVLIHGNSLRREDYKRFVNTVKSCAPDRPIVCNEDSPCYTQLDAAFYTGTSWGYYNNLTKQEPPASWGISNAEDLFFARRMARGLGVSVDELPADSQYILDGVKGPYELNGQRWIRLTAEYPETINYVDFLLNDKLADRSYQEPFYVNYENPWTQRGYNTKKGDVWKAVVHLADGGIVERVETVDNFIRVEGLIPRRTFGSSFAAIIKVLNPNTNTL
jgi:hypothetical protein